MFKTKEIMTKGSVYVHVDTPIFEAIQIMVNNGITGVPVVEKDMTLLGMLSEQDVLRLIHTHQQERNRTAGEFMTKPVISFEEEESLLDIVYSLKDSSIRRIPVTSDGKVIGIVSRADILRCIYQLLQEPCHVNSE